MRTEDLVLQVEAMIEDPDIHPVAPIVVAGAVLEARLRAMVQKAGALVTGQGSLIKYIEALRSARLINRLEWRELQVLAELRNQAAHGVELEKLTSPEARKMASGVGDFVRGHS